MSVPVKLSNIYDVKITTDSHRRHADKRTKNSGATSGLSYAPSNMHLLAVGLDHAVEMDRRFEKLRAVFEGQAAPVACEYQHL